MNKQLRLSFDNNGGTGWVYCKGRSQAGALLICDSSGSVILVWHPCGEVTAERPAAQGWYCHHMKAMWATK